MTWLFSPCSKWGNRGLEWWMLERITAELVVTTTVLHMIAQQALLIICPFLYFVSLPIYFRLVNSSYLPNIHSAFVRSAVKIILCSFPVAVFWAQPPWPVPCLCRQHTGSRRLSPAVWSLPCWDSLSDLWPGSASTASLMLTVLCSAKSWTPFPSLLVWLLSVLQVPAASPLVLWRSLQRLLTLASCYNQMRCFWKS